MANGELIDAREAMALLGIGENDLQAMVARGDLRAFRSGGTMKFRREDVVEMKSERGTEPTIIIPAAGKRKPGQSGILPAVDAASETAAAIPPVGAPAGASASREPGQTDATGEIVFDEIELLPTDDGLSTQQVTVQQPAITGADQAAATGAISADYAPTVIEPAASTGEMTVVESSAEEAAVSTGPAQPVGARPSVQRAPSRRGPSASRPAAPAVSRVRQPAVAAARRMEAVYQAKTAHPVWTLVMIANAAVLIFAAGILGILNFVGTYDEDSGQRIIPPHLKTSVYENFYYGDGTLSKLPGKPADADRPSGEPSPEPEAPPEE